MSVREAREKIDAREYAEWIAYNAISPIGDDRRDAMLAQIALVCASAWSGKGRRWTLRDFMLFSERKPEQTPEDMEAVFMRFAESHNRREARRGSRRAAGGEPDGQD